MPEQVRRQSDETWGGGPGLDDLFDAPGTCVPVTVCSGLYVEQLPVGNMSVGEVRARYADRFDIDPASQAVLDGRDVDDQTVIKPGQRLTFVRRAGEKGTARGRPHARRAPRR
jgi:hypothetical protein